MIMKRSARERSELESREDEVRLMDQLVELRSRHEELLRLSSDLADGLSGMWLDSSVTAARESLKRQLVLEGQLSHPTRLERYAGG